MIDHHSQSRHTGRQGVFGIRAVTLRCNQGVDFIQGVGFGLHIQTLAQRQTLHGNNNGKLIGFCCKNSSGKQTDNHDHCQQQGDSFACHFFAHHNSSFSRLTADDSIHRALALSDRLLPMRGARNRETL